MKNIGIVSNKNRFILGVMIDIIDVYILTAMISLFKKI